MIFMCKNKPFQSSETKNELHAKFIDENNSLNYNLSLIINYISDLDVR